MTTTTWLSPLKRMIEKQATITQRDGSESLIVMVNIQGFLYRNIIDGEFIGEHNLYTVISNEFDTIVAEAI